MVRKEVLRGKVISLSAYVKKKNTKSSRNLMVYFKAWDKQEETKQKQ